MEDDADRGADAERGVAEARKKVRGVDGVVAAGGPSAKFACAQRHVAETESQSPSPSALDALYDEDSKGAVCIAPHLRVKFATSGAQG